MSDQEAVRIGGYLYERSSAGGQGGRDGCTMTSRNKTRTVANEDNLSALC